MIVHSTHNALNDTCVVQVEGIEPAYPESLVVIFALGAAGKHNSSYDVPRGTVVEWLDENGRPLDPDEDTAFATGARVACVVEELA